MLLAFFALCKFSSDAHFTFCRGISFFVKTGSIYFVATGCFSSSDLFFFHDCIAINAKLRFASA